MNEHLFPSLECPKAVRHIPALHVYLDVEMLTPKLTIADAKPRSVLATLSDLDLTLYDVLAKAKRCSEASNQDESQWRTFLEDIATEDPSGLRLSSECKSEGAL